jgi:predicted nucleic acid-binding protein
VRRPRSREIDLAIAATAIAHDTPLWRLNPGNVGDVPRLRLALTRSNASFPTGVPFRIRSC